MNQKNGHIVLEIISVIRFTTDQAYIVYNKECKIQLKKSYGCHAKQAQAWFKKSIVERDYNWYKILYLNCRGSP